LITFQNIHEQDNVIVGIYAQAAKRGRKEAQLDEIGCDKGRNSQADIEQLMRSDYQFAFFSQHDVAPADGTGVSCFPSGNILPLQIYHK